MAKTFRTPTHDLGETVIVAERFYTRLYARDIRPGEANESGSSAREVALVSKEEAEEALKGMRGGKLQLTTA